MGRMEEAYTITKTMVALFDQPITMENQETTIHKLNDLLEKRETEMKQMTTPFTAQEQELGDTIIRMNGNISQHMTVLFEKIKNDMSDVKKRKQTNRSYLNPYGKIKSTDGMFLDSKQ